jgi:hypothetical protein
MKDTSFAPEYVFLHEFGHILQISLTNSNLSVPNEFIEFNNTILNVKLEQGSEEAIESFADTFAIAVMRGTDLYRYNPFPFPDTLNEIFEKFHFKLIEKYYDIVR